MGLRIYRSPLPQSKALSPTCAYCGKVGGMVDRFKYKGAVTLMHAHCYLHARKGK